MSNDFYNSIYNPDVLTCLANLSNDEVFTPPEIVNKMLDMLPQELFENPNTTFLDPCCKTGVFLREIAKRLLKGLEEKIPDLQKRIDHIFHKQLFGIAITEMTSLLSRRGVYCSKYPNSKFSVSLFDNAEGNIRYRKIKHTFKNEKCIYCGANKEQYGSNDELEQHAYEFIHNINMEEVFNMKFDVIIGNPPYQMSDGSGGSTDSAMPIYNDFIEQSIKLNPKFLVMITPSKWMVGGRGLKKFREKMKKDTHIVEIHDFENSNLCFPGIHLDGGVSYFLWDKEYDGPTKFVYYTENDMVLETTRYLDNEYFEFIIRDSRIFTILEKTKNEAKFSEIVSNVRPFGVRKDLFNNPNKYFDFNLSQHFFENSVKIYGVKGIKGGAKRTEAYIIKDKITVNCSCINKYKLFFTTSYSTNAVHPPKVIEGMPGEVCTETFLMIGPFESREKQENCLSYINSKFFKFLLFFGKGTMQVTKEVFSLIPLQDFSKSWTDEELYQKYGLTQEEIDFIELMIKPME